MKKWIAAGLAVCTAAALLPSVAACGGNQSVTLENGTVAALSDGGAAITAGNYRMDFYNAGEGYAMRVVDLEVSDKTENIPADALVADEAAPVHIGLKPVAATGDIMNVNTKEYFVDTVYAVDKAFDFVFVRAECREQIFGQCAGKRRIVCFYIRHRFVYDNGDIVLACVFDDIVPTCCFPQIKHVFGIIESRVF